MEATRAVALPGRTSHMRTMPSLPPDSIRVLDPGPAWAMMRHVGSLSNGTSRPCVQVDRGTALVRVCSPTHASRCKREHGTLVPCPLRQFYWGHHGRVPGNDLRVVPTSAQNEAREGGDGEQAARVVLASRRPLQITDLPAASYRQASKLGSTT
jgi:hypothetical protein